MAGALSVTVWTSFVLLLNAVCVIWAYFYVIAHIAPYKVQTMVNNNAGYQTFNVFFTFFAGFLFIVNTYWAWFAFFALSDSLKSTQSYKPVDQPPPYERDPESVSLAGSYRSSEKDLEKNSDKYSLKSSGTTSTSSSNYLIKSTKPQQKQRRDCRSGALFRIFKVVVLVIASFVGIFIAFGPVIAPFTAVTIAWRQEFRHICDGFNVRVGLDSKTMSAPSSVSFKQLSPPAEYFMTMSPNPMASNNVYNVFSLDSYYKPGASGFAPSYDAVHYNFTSSNYTLKLNGNIVHVGRFTTTPVFCLPDLNFTADSSSFVKQERNSPFFIGYQGSDSFLKTPHAWTDNSDVMLRTAKFTQNGPLQVCARGANDALQGLGDKLPVAVGLLMLLRGRRQIVAPMNNNGGAD